MPINRVHLQLFRMRRYLRLDAEQPADERDHGLSQCRALNKVDVQKTLDTTEITFAPCLFAVYERVHRGRRRSRQSR